MSKELLSEEQRKSFFMKGAESVLAEKKAGSGVSDILKGMGGVIMKTPGLLRDMIVNGAITGALTGMGYHIMKDNLTSQDLKVKFSEKVERIMAGKKREKEDSEWMSKARNMREELKRDWKRMPPEVYAAKYKALLDHLDERKA